MNVERASPRVEARMESGGVSARGSRVVRRQKGKEGLVHSFS